MPINVSIDGDVVVLSNFARLLNDPRHFDASRDVRALLEEGHRRFVFNLANLREPGPTAVGLLMTLTRLIRRHDGDAVVANATRGVEAFLEEMQLDAYWDIVPDVETAKAFLEPPED